MLHAARVIIGRAIHSEPHSADRRLPQPCPHTHTPTLVHPQPPRPPGLAGRQRGPGGQGPLPEDARLSAQLPPRAGSSVPCRASRQSLWPDALSLFGIPRATLFGTPPQALFTTPASRTLPSFAGASVGALVCTHRDNSAGPSAALACCPCDGPCNSGGPWRERFGDGACWSASAQPRRTPTRTRTGTRRSTSRPSRPTSAT